MKNADLLSLARSRLDEAASSDQANRELGEDDLKFLTGDQWDENARKERELAGKPILTVNGLSPFVRQVTGQIRSMNPAIKVGAADGAASEDTAEIMEGLIRQIEYQADATSIYEGATESAAACGIGHWRILAKYCDGETFDQEVTIKRIHNPFAVFWDPLAKDPTRADARYCFIVEEMARDDFEKTYPDVTPNDITSDHKTNTFITWLSAQTVTVAEYLWLETREFKIGMMADGRVVRNPRPPMDIIKTREATENVCMWAKITGGKVLEGPKELPTSFIPVVAVTGEEWHVGEQVYRSSVIRFAKDSQVLYNFAISSQAEIIAMQPKAPWLLTPEQIAGYEDMWATANMETRPYLLYNPDAKAGAPSRMAPPVSSAALTEQMGIAAEDMKRTTGIYDASLGARSNETSGVAIRSRQAEAQNNTSVYADNMVKAVTQTGRILVSMIPRVYDTSRIIRILGENDQEKMVAINQIVQTIDGIQPVNDLTIGKYDVRIGVGPSYQTKRQEAAEGMMAFMQANPQTAPLISDLIAGMQDWPDADKVAERIKKTLPPQLLEGDEQQQPDPMQQQQQAMQMQAQQQAMQMEQAKITAEIRKAEAEAVEAEADAMKAQIEAQMMGLQLNAGMTPRAPMGAIAPLGA